MTFISGPLLTGLTSYSGSVPESFGKRSMNDLPSIDCALSSVGY